MKDFNIAKYLKEHNLGAHGILGKYVDLNPIKEEEDYGNNKPVDEVPYVGAEEKLDGFGDEFDQVAPVEEVEMEEDVDVDDEDGSSDHFNKSVIAANMEQIYDQFEPQVQELISDIVDDGFDLEDAIKFLRNYADRLEKVKPF